MKILLSIDQVVCTFDDAPVCVLFWALLMVVLSIIWMHNIGQCPRNSHGAKLSWEYQPEHFVDKWIEGEVENNKENDRWQHCSFLLCFLAHTGKAMILEHVIKTGQMDAQVLHALYNQEYAHCLWLWAASMTVLAPLGGSFWLSSVR